MIHWHIEESLDLVSMQVHRNDTVDTSHTQKVGYEFGADTDTWLVLTILSGPSELGDDGIDGAGRGTLGGINHQQQFHQVV